MLEVHIPVLPEISCLLKKKREKLPVFVVVEKEEYSKCVVIFREMVLSVQGHFAPAAELS